MDRLEPQAFRSNVETSRRSWKSQSLVKDAHLKLIPELGGQRFDAIFFRRTENLPAKVRLAYRPVINEFMGRRSVQLVIEAAEA